MRVLQTAAPLLSARTGYEIAPGPYAEDARGSLPDVRGTAQDAPSTGRDGSAPHA